MKAFHPFVPHKEVAPLIWIHFIGVAMSTYGPPSANVHHHHQAMVMAVAR